MAEPIFNAKEIARQASRMNEQSDNLDITSNEIIKELREIDLIISNSTEDKSKWVSVGEYSQAFMTVLNKASIHFKALATEMNTWAEETELAEQRAAGKIGKLNEPIEKIRAMFNILSK